MGLGLPDGGHLTHGYYVRATHGIQLQAYSRSIPSDCEEEDDRVVHLLPVPPVLD